MSSSFHAREPKGESREHGEVAWQTRPAGNGGCWGSNPAGVTRRSVPSPRPSATTRGRRCGGSTESGRARRTGLTKQSQRRGRLLGPGVSRGSGPKYPPPAPRGALRVRAGDSGWLPRGQGHHRVFIKRPLCAKGVPKTWNQVNAFPLLTAADSGISQEGVIVGFPRHTWGFRRGNDSSVQRLP